MKNSGREFKDQIYEQLARIGKGISSPKRLELLDILCQGEKNVEKLAKETGLSIANASQHLQVLRAARLVEAKKEGTFVTYRIADKLVSGFFRNLQNLAEHRLAEIERITCGFFKEKENMEKIDADTLWKRMREGTVILLDVRPVKEFQAGHIEGATNIPLEELEKRLPYLANDKEIVAYCRGPYCVLAVQAVEVLRKIGFRTIHFKGSVQDWEAKGFPVAIG